MKAYIYIMTNKHNGLLYIGFTRDLVRRITEHRLGIIKGFTTRYNLDRLVYFEEFDNVKDAEKRELQLKKYSRQRKINLIEAINLEWLDLYNHIMEKSEYEFNITRSPSAASLA